MIKKLFAALMAMAMVVSVAPAKAALTGPTVCTEGALYLNTVEKFVEGVVEAIEEAGYELETLKLTDEFAFQTEAYVTIEQVLAVKSKWGKDAEITLQDALTDLVTKGCATTDEEAYLAGLVAGVKYWKDAENVFEQYLGEEGYLTEEKYWDEINSKETAIAKISEAQKFIDKLTNVKTTKELAYVGNVEDLEEMIEEGVEALEEAIAAVAEEYHIELASSYYDALVAYLKDVELAGKKVNLIETTTSSITGKISEEVITIDELVAGTTSLWVKATKRAGTTYDLGKLIEAIEEDELKLPGSYEDFEEDVEEIMAGLEDLLAASEALDELVEEIKDLEAATTKIGKAAEAEAETMWAAAGHKDTWDKVFAEADFAELKANINLVEFGYLAEMMELIEEEFITVTYTEKGSRWIAKPEATENYPHMEVVFAAADVKLPVLFVTAAKGSEYGLLDNYYDAVVAKDYTGETNWKVLVEYMESVEADLEAINDVKGITVNNLNSKNIDKVLAAREALDVKTTNLTAVEAKKVADSKANIDVLYLKALFSGVTTEKVTGWVELGNGNWDYYDADGNVFTGWVAAGSNWYYVSNGHMLRNTWVAKDATGAVWYYLGADGAMVSNTVVDGYAINANGEWVK